MSVLFQVQAALAAGRKAIDADDRLQDIARKIAYDESGHIKEIETSEALRNYKVEHLTFKHIEPFRNLAENIAIMAQNEYKPFQAMLNALITENLYVAWVGLAVLALSSRKTKVVDLPLQFTTAILASVVKSVDLLSLDSINIQNKEMHEQLQVLSPCWLAIAKNTVAEAEGKLPPRQPPAEGEAADAAAAIEAAAAAAAKSSRERRKQLAASTTA